MIDRGRGLVNEGSLCADGFYLEVCLKGEGEGKGGVVEDPGVLGRIG